MPVSSLPPQTGRVILEGARVVCFNFPLSHRNGVKYNFCEPLQTHRVCLGVLFYRLSPTSNQRGFGTVGSLCSASRLSESQLSPRKDGLSRSGLNILSMGVRMEKFPCQLPPCSEQTKLASLRRTGTRHSLGSESGRGKSRSSRTVQRHGCVQGWGRGQHVVFGGGHPNSSMEHQARVLGASGPSLAQPSAWSITQVVLRVSFPAAPALLQSEGLGSQAGKIPAQTPVLFEGSNEANSLFQERDRISIRAWTPFYEFCHTIFHSDVTHSLPAGVFFPSRRCSLKIVTVARGNYSAKSLYKMYLSN